MSRQLIIVVLVAACGAIGGCAMCCATHDYEYSAYGGHPHRVDRVCGRVGSIRDKAAARHDFHAGYRQGDIIDEAHAMDDLTDDLENFHDYIAHPVGDLDDKDDAVAYLYAKIYGLYGGVELAHGDVDDSPGTIRYANCDQEDVPDGRENLEPDGTMSEPADGFGKQHDARCNCQ